MSKYNNIEFLEEPEGRIREKAKKPKGKFLSFSRRGRLSIPSDIWDTFSSKLSKKDEVFFTAKFNEKLKIMAVTLYDSSNRPTKCRKVQRYTGRDSKKATTTYLDLLSALKSWSYIPSLPENNLGKYIKYDFDSRKRTLFLELKSVIKKSR